MLRRSAHREVGTCQPDRRQGGVGKSTVIEALQVYASPQPEELLLDLARRRDEHRYPFRKTHFSLFNSWNDREDEIRIGSGTDAVQVGIVLVPPDLDPDRQEPTFLVSGGLSSRKAVFVGPNSLTVERQAELWDEVALSALEDEVMASLQLVMPDIERISLIAGKIDPSRVPFVRVKGAAHPFPLKRLGDGVNRLFALALVHAKGGLLLLDEIDNGIHYSLQESVWTFISRGLPAARYSGICHDP